MKARDEGRGQIRINCPACNDWHVLNVNPEFPCCWGFNGDFERPTFTPSLLHNVGGRNKTKPICHSFITDGNIQFLGDCTHDMKGKTVPLPDFED